MSDAPGRNIWEAVEAAASACPWKTALQVDTVRHSYRELWESSRRLARALSDLGAGPGDVIALWLLNGFEWVVGLTAANRIGAIAVAFNTRLRAEEIDYLLGQSRAKVLVVSHRRGGIDFVDLAYELLPELRNAEGRLQSARYPDLEQVICTGPEPRPGMHSWPQLVEAADPDDSSLPLPSSDTVALIQYTSGSTARPKGAMLTGRAIVRDSTCFGDRLGIGPADRFFVANPMFHVAGAVSGFVNAVAHQATLITMEHYEAAAALDLLERERCTARLGSEVMVRREMAHPSFTERDLSALKKGSCMGSADTIRLVNDRMGITGIAAQYGLSEGTSVVATPQRTDPLEVRATTVGRPFEGVEIQVVAPDSGLPVAPEVDGEILVRGWNVMSGYYRNPAATAAAIDADGWFHTGDLGQLDRAGNLVFRGRLKDVVRVGAENVSALEVENFLARHPAVKIVQVVAAADDDLGEVPFAFIELQDGWTLAESELLGLCTGRLARFKIPRGMATVADWPMTGNGKIRKVSLREQATALWRARGQR